MKYGVLYRKTTKNIGDDVQSYAEKCFLPRVDYMVDIEDLEGFKAEDDEPVATIMSAWYMWQKWNWPPSKNLYPLWVGFHYDDGQRGRPRGMPIKFEYIQDGPGKAYLDAYAPIGCRDYRTKKNLDKLGIENYFSGCVTLTLKKRDIPKPEKEYIVINDVEPRVRDAVIKQVKEATGGAIDVIVVKPTRTERSTNIPWEEREKKVLEYLDLYQNAKCVVSFRLHCCLPCLALETPVLCVREKFDSPRFNPYKDWMHTASPQDVVDGKFVDFILNPPENPKDYLTVRHSLEKTITEFISNAEKETRKASELYRINFAEEEMREWKDRLMRQSLANYVNEIDLDTLEMKKYKAKINQLNDKLKKTQLELKKTKQDLEDSQSGLIGFARMIKRKLTKKK